MDRKSLIGISILFSFVMIGIVSLFLYSRNYKTETNTVEATVLYMTDSTLTVQASNSMIYTFDAAQMDVAVGDTILIEYVGVLDKMSEKQNASIVDFSILKVSSDTEGIPSEWMDDGIFSDYYLLAYRKLQTLTLDEKIGQLFLVRYPSSGAVDALKKYKFGGFVFYEKDFKNKSKEQVLAMIDEVQGASSIPLLTAVDEEGGKVVRVSSNPALVPSKFKSAQTLYQDGGLSLIKQDTIDKSKLLSSLGLNLNLAPVIDVSTNPSDYMYERTLGKGTALTSEYAKTVIASSKGTGVSYTLKHFPGYGNNSDTHTGSSIDTRTYADIVANDLPPFKEAIEVGAEAVLVSHNIVNSIDASNPASLSTQVHNLLRGELDFTGIVITDDLDMGAVSSIPLASLKAILAGNDLIISTDYETDIQNIKAAVEDGSVSESTIDKLAFRILAWKYYKGLMFNSK